ncbi:MAG: hypothetical protein LUF92_03460 [Clostridiales bacterium]|nr:hypothetical protein [Clostridiales bacterium]
MDGMELFYEMMNDDEMDDMEDMSEEEMTIRMINEELLGYEMDSIAAGEEVHKYYEKKSSEKE